MKKKKKMLSNSISWHFQCQTHEITLVGDFALAHLRLWIDMQNTALFVELHHCRQVAVSRCVDVAWKFCFHVEWSFNRWIFRQSFLAAASNSNDSGDDVVSWSICTACRWSSSVGLHFLRLRSGCNRRSSRLWLSNDCDRCPSGFRWCCNRSSSGLLYGDDFFLMRLFRFLYEILRIEANWWLASSLIVSQITLYADWLASSLSEINLLWLCRCFRLSRLFCLRLQSRWRWSQPKRFHCSHFIIVGGFNAGPIDGSVACLLTFWRARDRHFWIVATTEHIKSA